MAKSNGSNGNGNGNHNPKTFQGAPLVLRAPRTPEERKTRADYFRHLHDEEGLTDKEIGERCGLNVTRVCDLRNDWPQRFAERKRAEAEAAAKAEAAATKPARKRAPAAAKVVAKAKSAPRKRAARTPAGPTPTQRGRGR